MTRTAAPKEDFASAAMMRLVQAGLAQQGLMPQANRPRGAHVPRVAKQDVLGDVLRAHGPLAILRIADTIPHMPPEPVLQALLLAKDLADLMDRWARVEVFSHKRHRIETVHDNCAVTLSHVSRAEGHRPTMAESLLVLGVLTRLAEIATSAQARLEIGAGAVWREQGHWHEHALPDVLPGVRLTCHGATHPAHPPTLEPALPAIDALKATLKSDPVRRWKVGDLARESGLSVRSLQRKLAEQSLSFSTLVADTRLETAAEQLCAPNGPGLSEVGFLAGYADQAHFTRAFKQAVGTTPGEYRAEFRAA